MQIGHLRINFNHAKKKWAIQGRKNGRWTNCFDDDRIKQGLDKWIFFDLKYDACGALLSYAEFVYEVNLEEGSKQYGRKKSPLMTMIRDQNQKENEYNKRKKRRKLQKQSRKRNRK